MSTMKIVFLILYCGIILTICIYLYRKSKKRMQLLKGIGIPEEIRRRLRKLEKEYASVESSEELRLRYFLIFIEKTKKEFFADMDTIPHIYDFMCSAIDFIRVGRKDDLNIDSSIPVKNYIATFYDVIERDINKNDKIIEFNKRRRHKRYAK